MDVAGDDTCGTSSMLMDLIGPNDPRTRPHCQWLAFLLQQTPGANHCKH